MAKLDRNKLRHDLIRLGVSEKRSKALASNISNDVICEKQDEGKKTRRKNISEVVKEDK